MVEPAIIDKEKIGDLLQEIFSISGRYEITDQGFVNVFGHCHRRENSKTYAKLPFKFGEVTRTFDVAGLGLTSLSGSPLGCKLLRINSNNITSFDDCPQGIHTISCMNNGLTSLIGMPPSVRHIFATGNPITSLEGLPKIVLEFTLTYHKECPLLKLLRINPQGWSLDRSANFQPVQFQVERIIRKYGKGKDTTRADILACQRELIQSGFEGNAAW